MQNAIALLVSSGGSALLGVVFWSVAAHVATATAVGKATATIAAMLLLATLAQLSFGNIFERFLPVAGDRTLRFVARSYQLSIGCAVVLATGYVLLDFGDNFLPPGFGGGLFFIVSVIMWAIFALQDSALIGLRSSRWVAVENISYGVVKLAILPACVAISATQGIYVAWTIPVLGCVVAITLFLFRRTIPAHMAMAAHVERLPSTGELFRLSSAQYASQLSSVFLPAIVTLIVIHRLGAIANAYFYLASTIYYGLTAFLWSIVKSFLVEASHEPHELRRHANSAIRGLAFVLIPSIAIGVIFAPVILKIFGSAYAVHGTDLMRMLLISLVGTAVMLFYNTFAWLDQRVWWMTVRNVLSSAIYLVLVVVLIPHLGINAIGVAALANAAVTLLIFLPVSIRRYRRT